MVGQSHELAQLVLLQGAAHVDFVSEHHKRHVAELGHGEQLVQLSLRLLEAGLVGRVNHIDQAIQGAAVVGPGAARRLMAAQVVRVEADVSDGDLRGVGVLRGVRLGEFVGLQHVEHGGLALREGLLAGLARQRLHLLQPEQHDGEQHFQHWQFRQFLHALRRQS